MADDKVQTAEVEVLEPAEVEVLQPEEESRELSINDHDLMDSVIEVGAKIDAYAKAMDSILNAIIKRSYEGDWVCHAKKTDPIESKKANLGAAAAERVAQFLGIQEKNWTRGIKDWSDDKKHYTWTYEADFGFKSRWVHAIGKAGTRDKFFGFAYKQWKPLDEIQEDHVKTAAFRACRKEGVRTLFGLRSIPLNKLKLLGYDIERIAYAGFEDKGRDLTADEKKTAADGLIWRSIVVERAIPTEGTFKGKDGKPDPAKGKWNRLDVFDKDKVRYGLFGQGKRWQKLVDCADDQSVVEIGVKLKQFNNQDQYEIVKVKGVEE